MTQEEIIKLAQEAGFENYAYEAVGIFERFARLVSAAEREKFTNTQEFVTLPRAVVEQAIDALYCTDSEEGSPAYNFELKAVKELRAALEQPHTTEQSYMGCVTSDMHELAEWLNTMYEDSKEQIAALDQPPATEQSLAVQQPQGEQEPVAWIRTEWSSRNVTFDGPPAVPSVRDELTKPAWTPLYTRPQPKREPLSLAQIAEVFGWKPGYLPTPEQVHDARAVEAAHNIK